MNDNVKRNSTFVNNIINTDIEAIQSGFIWTGLLGAGGKVPGVGDGAALGAPGSSGQLIGAGLGRVFLDGLRGVHHGRGRGRLGRMRGDLRDGAGHHGRSIGR